MAGGATASSGSLSVLFIVVHAADLATRLTEASQSIAGRTYSHRPGNMKSTPRVMRPKPHKSMTQKPC